MNLAPLKRSLIHFGNRISSGLIQCRTNYQSAINLKALYPESSLKITTPDEKEIDEKKTHKFSGYIPIEKLDITACRSSGPGGQNVNKINTKVVLRFHLASADWIPESLRKRMLEIKQNQLTKEGHIIIRSDKTRSHQLNLADALQRLRTIIYNCEEVVTEPDPEKLHVIRKRKEKANRERLEEKRHRSMLKQMKRDSYS